MYLIRCMYKYMYMYHSTFLQLLLYLRQGKRFLNLSQYDRDSSSSANFSGTCSLVLSSLLSSGGAVPAQREREREKETESTIGQALT